MRYFSRIHKTSRLKMRFQLSKIYHLLKDRLREKKGRIPTTTPAPAKTIILDLVAYFKVEKI